MVRTTTFSAYRQAERAYEGRPDEFLEYLEAHRLEDVTLCLGYWLRWAERELNFDQATVAARTEVRNAAGEVAQRALTRGYLSQVLTGATSADPRTWARLADAVGCNPVEFYLAEGWLRPAHIESYTLLDSHLYQPLLETLHRISDRTLRRSAVAVATATVDTILQMQTKKEPAKEK